MRGREYRAEEIRTAGRRGGQQLAAERADALRSLDRMLLATDAFYTDLHERQRSRERLRFTGESADGRVRAVVDGTGAVDLVSLAWPDQSPPSPAALAGAVEQAVHAAVAAAAAADPSSAQAQVTDARSTVGTDPSTAASNSGMPLPPPRQASATKAGISAGCDATGALCWVRVSADALVAAGPDDIGTRLTAVIKQASAEATR